jgi:hypothetical protein
MSEEELNQMSNNELIGIIKAQKFEIEQLENIRKEAIKYVQEKADYPISYYHCLNDLLNILNKGDNK